MTSHHAMVLAHARALLTSSPQGTCDYIDADLREPGKILARASQTLDLTQPVAVLLIAVLHFIPGDDDPRGIVTRLRRACQHRVAASPAATANVDAHQPLREHLVRGGRNL